MRQWGEGRYPFQWQPLKSSCSLLQDFGVYQGGLDICIPIRDVRYINRSDATVLGLGYVIPFRFVSGIMSACQRYSIRR